MDNLISSFLKNPYTLNSYEFNKILYDTRLRKNPTIVDVDNKSIEYFEFALNKIYDKIKNCININIDYTQLRLMYAVIDINIHRYLVEDARNRKENIPEEVRSEYPDLFESK